MSNKILRQKCTAYQKEYATQVLESTRYVLDNSEHVKISDKGIDRFCKKNKLIAQRNIDWLQKSPFSLDRLNEKEKTHLMLTFNSLSFSYWGEPYWKVTYNNTTYQRGSWSLIAALLRAREEGIDILNPSIQSSVSKKDLKYILRGNREIPLLNERLQIINQVGTTIQDRYRSDFRNMIYEAKKDASRLLSSIINQIPSFEDTAKYKGKTISFYKRAQALVESMSALHNLAQADKLTALADYILPRKLRDEGILLYSTELARVIDNKIDIPPRSIYEVEIRANTIQAVERIKEHLAKKNVSLTRKEINDHLWLTGNKEITNFHRTRTTAY